MATVFIISATNSSRVSTIKPGKQLPRDALEKVEIPCAIAPDFDHQSVLNSLQQEHTIKALASSQRYYCTFRLA